MAVQIDIPFPELRKAIVTLNESNLLASVNQEKLTALPGIKNGRIMLVAINRENMLGAFMSAFDLIEDVEGKCPAPKEALAFYNKVITLEDKATEAIVSGVDNGTSTEKEKNTSAKKTKDNNCAKAKEKKAPNKYNHHGAEQRRIDDCFESGTSEEEVANILVNEFGYKNIKKGKSRFRAYCQHYVEDHGLTISIDKETGIYKIAN